MKGVYIGIASALFGACIYLTNGSTTPTALASNATISAHQSEDKDIDDGDVPYEPISLSLADEVDKSSLMTARAGGSQTISADLRKNCNKLGLPAKATDNKKLYAAAASWLGVKYVYGAMSKTGTDCSGMTLQIIKEAYGKTISRSSRGILADNCKKVPKQKLKAGDLVFFRTDGRKTDIPNHVGIYLKKKCFIHASCSHGVVVSSLEQDYYKKAFLTGGRVRK